MIDVTVFTQYAQCRVILEALTRAGNRQAQVVQDASEWPLATNSDRDGARARYNEILDAVNQAQLACDRALLAIAQIVVESDTPLRDVASMSDDAGFGWMEEGFVFMDIFAELQAITQEAR
jgi:hypothetical protein